MNIKGVIDSILEILDKIKKNKQLSRNINAIIKLFYIECKLNKYLLDTLEDSGKNKSTEIEYLYFVKYINIEMLEFILQTGEENTKLFDLLTKTLTVNISDSEKKDDRELTFFELISLLYIKIKTLKILADSNLKNTTLKQLRYKVRLKNIQNHYRDIIYRLSKFSGIMKLIVS